MASVDVLVDDGDSFTVIAASSLITLGKGRIGKLFLTAGAGDSSVILYDGRDDNGKFLFQLDVLASTTNGVDFYKSIPYRDGIYIAVTGAGSRTFISWLSTG